MKDTTNTEKVNTKLLKNFKKSLLASLLYGIETESFIKQNPYFGDFYYFDEEENSAQEKCDFGFSSRLAKIEPPRPRVDTKAEQEKYRAYWQAILEKGNISASALTAWTQNRREHAPIIRVSHAHGEAVHFRGALRGTKEYAEKLQATMKKDAWELQQRYKYVYFLTYTFNAKRYTESRVGAWKEYSKKISTVMAALRQKYGFGYQWVTESTKHEYPHVHIVLFSNELIDASHKMLKAGTRIYTGELYRFCRDHSPANQFRLEFAESKNVVKYLMKYVGKAASKDAYKEPDTNDKEAFDTWRKNILSMFCSAVCGVRGYSKSQWKRVALLETGRTDGVRDYVATEKETASRVIWSENEVYTPNFEFLFSVPKDYFITKVWLGQWSVFLHKIADTHAHSLQQTALDWLLTNSSKRCAKIVDLITDKGCKLDYLRIENGENVNFGQFSKKVDACALPVGCRDCILKRLYMRRAGFDVPLDPERPTKINLSRATFTVSGNKDIDRIPFNRSVGAAQTASADSAKMAVKATDTTGEHITAKSLPERKKSWQKVAEEENERLGLGDSGLAQIKPEKIKTKQDFIDFKKWVSENYDKVMGEREVIHRIKGEVMDKVLAGQKVQMHYDRLYWTVAIVSETGGDRGNLSNDWLEAFDFVDGRVLPFCHYSLNPDDALKFSSHQEAYLMATLLGKYTDGAVNAKVYQCGTGKDILADVVTGKEAMR